jgi:hypothetical protein
MYLMACMQVARYNTILDKIYFTLFYVDEKQLMEGGHVCMEFVDEAILLVFLQNDS